MSEFVTFVMGVLGTCGFSLIFRVPAKRFSFAVLGGAISCGMLVLFNWCMEGHMFLVNLIATTVSAVYCEVAARLLKTPVTMLMLPTLVPLAPGYHLYYATFYLVHNDMALCWQYAANTLIVATGIAVGIVAVSLVIRLIRIPKLQIHLHK